MSPDASTLMILTVSLAGGVAAFARGSLMELAGVRAGVRAATEPLDLEGPAMLQQRYKLKIYDGQYEVLANRPFFIDLDLDSPAAEMLLLQRLKSLTALAISHNEPMAHPRLEVCDMTSGKLVMELVA